MVQPMAVQETSAPAAPSPVTRRRTGPRGRAAPFIVVLGEMVEAFPDLEHIEALHHSLESSAQERDVDGSEEA